VNPYVAPTATADAGPSLPAWTAPSLRMASAIVALDLARGVTWRLSTAAGLGGNDHFNPNVVIQLAFAVGLVFAVTALTRRRDAGTDVAPTFRRAAVATSIAAVSMYATRFIVIAVTDVFARPGLELATVALDAGVVVLSALWLAALLREVGDVRASLRVKQLTTVYAVAMIATLVVVTDLISGRHGFLPLGVGRLIRTIVSLLLLGLAVGAYAFVQRLARRSIAAT